MRMYGIIDEFIKMSKSTQAKQIIWSRLFMEGIKNLIEKANSTNYTQELQKQLEQINLKDNKEEILNERIIHYYIAALQEMQYNKEKEIEEKQEQQKQEQRKQEKKLKLEQYKNLTSDEIEEKIKKLDDDKFDIVTSYENIMEYQLKVAKAKGLINERNILETDDIKITRVERKRIPFIFGKLKDQICNFEIYTDVDNSNDNVYIVTPKNNKSELKENLCINNGYNGQPMMINVTDEFINTYLLCANKGKEIIKANDGKIYFWFYNENTVIEDIKKLLNQYKKENYENAKKVKFYIEIPYRRTIIPILEELQQNKIEFTIPPTDGETKMNIPTVKIYMDRSDLERYKEKVHSKISTIEKGIVKIGEEEINIDQILIEGCDFKFLEEDREIK